MCLNLWRQLEFELPNYNWAIKVFDTIQNLFCNPLRSLAARVFGTEKRRRRRGTRIFWTDERIFSFLFWAFLVVPFSLSLLSKRNNILIKNKNTKRHNKKGKVPSSIERRLFGLFLLSYFSISATHSRSFVCSRQIVEEKKELSFFLSLSKAPERTRKERDEKRKKKLLFLSLFLIEKAKTFCKSPKKTRRRRRRKKT